MKATFVKRTRLSPEIYSFYFKVSSTFDYIAGQFIELSLTDNSHDNRGGKRWFSLSSSPSEDLLSITTRLVTKNSTFKQRLFKLSAGDIVGISQPMGDFVLPKNPKSKLVFVAIGIGITPFRSMIKFFNDRSETRDITLFYSSNSSDNFIFKNEIKSPFIELILVNEKINIDLLLRKIDPETKTKVFIAGPEKAVEQLANQLEINGIEKKHISVDFFHNYDKL